VLAFFDFSAAFPSMFHGWIHATVKSRNFPVGARNFLKCLFAFNGAFARIENELLFLYWYASGVLQGCPASAFCFDISLDPFLEAFQKEIADKNRGIVRACADDIGAALADIKYLSVLYPIFCQARVLAGLTLKPIKCVLVPLSAPLTRASKYDIQKWLERKIPEWVNFNLRFFDFLVNI
jgi:hypothetical protein